MKKWVFLSALLVILLAVAACGGSKVEPTQPPPPPPAHPTASQAEAGIPPTAAVPPTKAAPPTQAPAASAEAASEQGGGMDTELDTASLGEPADLSSYRSTMEVMIKGKANGQEVTESFHFLLEHTSDPLAQHIVMTGQGTDGEPGSNAIEMYLVEGTMYMKMDEQWLSMPANEGEALTEGMIAPSDLVEGTCGWKNKGKTTINGVKVEHWTLDMADMQKCVPTNQTLDLEKVTNSGGDLYVAEDGGYMVQMDLFFEGEDLELNLADNAEPVQEGRMEIHYKLTDVNQPFNIELPPDAKASGAPPEDIPIPKDAQEVNSMMGITTFLSPSSPQEMADFYKAEMPKSGWTEVSVDEMNGMFMLEYGKEGKSAKMVIQTDEEKQMTSVFITVAAEE